MPNSWFDTLHGPRLRTLIEDKGDALMERYHVDDPHFAVWLYAVDRAVRHRIFLSFDDLEDWDYATAYEDDMSPRDAAVQMLEDNGWAGAFLP